MKNLERTRELAARQLRRVQGGGTLAVAGYNGPPLAAAPAVGLGFANLPVATGPREYNDPRKEDPVGDCL